MKSIEHITWDSLPHEVRRQAKTCLLDTLAVAAAASTLPNSAQICRLIQQQFGDGPCPILFTRTKTTFVGAAFANAFILDSLDCHDGFRMTKGHVGATVISTVLSYCSEKNINGKQLLAAVVTGYEIACRAGLAIHKHYAPAYHASGSWAALGAAAAMGKLNSLPDEQMDVLIGMAEYYAPMSPMMRCIDYPCSLKDSAAAGALAAAMAWALFDNGLTGLPSILTADESGRSQMQSLGTTWLILEQYFKPYPVCRWAQPAVEAALELKNKHAFEHRQIRSIEVESFQACSRLMYFPPENSDQAQYSLPWALAASIVDGRLNVAQVHPDRLDDPDILSLGAKIVCTTAEDLERRFPKECLSRITIYLTDGTQLKSHVHRARGDYDDPLTAEQLENKSRQLFLSVIDKNRTQAIIDTVNNLENYNSVMLLKLL